MRVLIIEDRPEIASLLGDWVGTFSSEVLIADKLEDAVKIINESPPHTLISLDLNLLDSRSEETMAQIPKIRASNPDAVLIVLTGVATPKDEQRIRDLGADALIEKLDVPTKKTFMDKLRDVVVSLIRQPTRFQRNIAVLEALSRKIARDVQSQ